MIDRWLEILMLGVAPALIGVAGAMIILWTGRKDRRNQTQRKIEIEDEMVRLAHALHVERAKGK